MTWTGVTGATGYQLRIWDGDHLGNRSALEPDEEVEDEEVTYTTAATVGEVALAAGTSYYFVIRAVDDQGTTTTTNPTFDDDYSDWSDPENGRTKSIVPGAPTDLDVTNRDSSSIWLSWTPADGEVAGGPVTSYTIEWRQGTSQTRRIIQCRG